MSRYRVGSAAVVALLTLVACGSDDDATSESSAAVSTEQSAPAATEAPVETSEPGGATTPAGSVLDQALIDTAAAAFLEGQAAQGVTAFHIAISDPVAGEFATAYGDASVDGPEATVDDSFRIGSISKTFTATVILQLVESGDISLDDTVGALLPDLAAAHPEIEPLTVEQLLTMASGISDYLNGVDTVVPVVVDDPSTVWAPEELVAAGVEAGAAGPGTLGYSTTNFIILQMIAESVTGSTLQELIAENVADPLGLDGIFLPPNDDTTLPDPAVHGYLDGACLDEVEEDGATVAAGTDTTDWNASYGQGGGGMTATISDLLGWAASGSGNSLLDETTVEQRMELQVLPELIAYGQGMMVLGPWIGHEGEAIGWEALALQDPATGTAVAMAGNGCGGLFNGFLDVLVALYPEIPPY
jgi:D-alanyl-D-alanine carboxypeptidase